MNQKSTPRNWGLANLLGAFRRTRRKPARKAFLPALECLEVRVVPYNADVLGFHNDAFLSGQNLQEEVLTPANVNSTSFGKLFSQPVDGPIYAQPLYKANLMIGGTPHNVAFVATEHDSVYAFDMIDSPTAGITLNQVWQTSFINPPAGITPIPASELGNPDIVPEIGITGTPVIDGTTNTIYVLARTKEVRSGVPHYVQKLHALDITTGAEKFGGPYTLGDTTAGGPDGGWTNTTSIVVPGTGDGAGTDGMVRFNAGREMQRPALQLSSGTVYIAWASQADFRPYHGWVIGFNAATLQPVRWFNTTPNAGGAGIWESGGGLSVDPQGNLYFAEGNGFDGPNPAFDPLHGNYSESVLKLTPSGTQLGVGDYFTPFEWRDLDTQDADLGSGGTMLLPDFVGSAAHPHVMVELGKSGKIYLIDRDNMGQFTAGGPDHVVQTVTAGQRGVWGNPAFFQVNGGNGTPGSGSGIIYYHGTDDVLKGYTITNGHIDDVNILRSNFNSQFPGTQPVVSANGIANPTSPTNGITWELQVDAHGLGAQPNTPAILRAFPSTNLGTELYDSSQTGLRDQTSPSDHGNKFTSLTVSNGHVLIGTFGFFSVYGLFPTATAVPVPSSNLAGTLQSGPAGPQIQLTWTNPVPTVGMAPTGIKIQRSLDGATFTPYTTVPRDATTFSDTGPFVIGQRYYYRVIATNQHGDSTPSDPVNVLVPIGSSVLTLTGTSASSIGLSWTPVANDHYDIERSTDGITFNRVATVPSFQTSYTDAGLAPGIYAYRIHAFNVNPGAESLSNVQGASIGSTIDHNAGFTNTTDLTPNGSTQFAETTVRLTSGATQTGSAFSNTRITTAQFTTTFELRIHEGTQPNYADGIAFVLQAKAPTALGQGLGGLGYQGIGNSVAVKFSTFQHTGDPSSSSTGLVLNGANPAGGADTTPTGVLLNSQDQKDITLNYDGTTLSEQIVDVPRHLTFTASFTVNIPQVLGSDTAYVGFTGATGSGSGEGGFWEDHDIVNWTFTSQAPLPGAPSNLRVASSASSQINLAWNANSWNETGFQIERSPDGSAWSQVGTSTTTSFSDVGLVAGTWYYRVRTVNASGSSPYSNVLRSGVPGPILTQDQDVGTPGDPAVPGSAMFAGGAVYTNSGAGSDIWNQADGFHFAYKPLLGDGMITARVLNMSSIQDTTFWAKAGVMIRETLNANSRDAYVTMTPQGHNQVQFLDRVDTGGNAADIGDATGIPFPIWVRVVRQGNTFTGFYSTDGATFNQLGGPVTIAMAPTTYVGLVASAANANGSNPNAISTSMFDNVSVVPAQLQTSHLDVRAGAPAVNPGTPVSITVQALDQYNNPVPGYRGMVHFTSSDAMATVPGDYPFTAADNGRHTFMATLRSLGSQTVLATDTTTGVITGSTAVLVTNQPVLSSLVVAGFPSPVVAGVQGSFTVTARDGQGNTFTGYRGTVHLASSDPRAQLQADYPFTAADAGVHTFTATLITPGTQSLTATDTVTQISGAQSGIQVVAPPSITTLARSAAVIAPGGMLTVSGTFTDQVTQTHQVVVSWGDGSGDTTLPLATGFTFSTSHPYAQAGNFEIHVTVTGPNGGSDAAVLTVSAASVAPPSGLVSWWTGDGTNPTTAADIAGSNPGTLVNGATHAPGQVGNAFSFNGTNQWVIIPTGTNVPIGNATYTLMAWIKPTAASNGGIIGYGNYGTGNQTNAFRLLDDGTGHLNFRHYWWANDLDAFTSIPANSGAWHLAAAEFDGTTRRVLLDGNVIAMDTPAPGHNVPNAANFAIGGVDFFGGVSQEVFNGLIDEPQVYNRALTQAEIQGIFNAGSAGQIKGVRVQVVPPPVITTLSRSAAVINEGGTLTVSGNFTDPVAGQTHQVTVNWGDNTTNTTVSLAVGVTAFSAGHLYAEEGNFEIRVTVTAANMQSDTVILTASAAAAAPPSGLVGWWTGDGTSPNTAPDIAGSNPGTLTNGATHGAGQVGNAFSLNGNNQYIDLPTGTNIPVGNATYTLMAWIRPAAAGNEGIIGYGNYGNANQVNAFRLVDNGEGHLNLLNYWWANDLEADTNVPATGAWHLAVAEFDGTTRRILLDGVVIGMDTPTGHNVPSPSNFRIGSTNRGEYFNGLIDESQVYNRALTQAEVQAIFTAGAAGLVKGARVSDPAVVPTGGFTATAYAGVASSMQPLAVFSDPGGAEALADYSALINWGDNTAASAGTISFNAGTGVFTVQGSHPYARTGNYAVTVTIHHDAALAATVASSAQVFAPVLHLAGFPSPTVAGTTGNLTVTVQDALGATLGGYRGTAHFTSTDSQAGLPTDYTFTAADNGMHTFSATLKTAGSHSLTATDTATAGVSGTQSGIVIIPAAASTFAVSEFPNATVSGAPGGLLVSAKDAFGNTATGYRGTVHIDSSAASLLPDDYTFTAADNGSHSFGIVLSTVGPQTVTATDLNTPAISGTGAVTVTPRYFTLTGSPSETTAGVAFSFVLTAYDVNNNVADGYRGTVQFSSSDPRATPGNGLPADYTFTAGDAGVHTFNNVVLKTAGQQFITATDPLTPDRSNGSLAIVIDPAAATHLTIGGFPTTVTAGDTNTVTVTALDAFENIATGYTGTVHLTSNDPAMVNSGDSTLGFGQGTFSVTLSTASPPLRSITATDTVTPSLTATQDGITVNPAAPFYIFVTTPYPSPVTAGTAHPITITITDVYGNTIPNYAGTVHVSSSDPQLTPFDYPFVPATDHGVHTFNLTLKTAGAQSISFDDAAGIVVGDIQTLIQVNAAAMAGFAVYGYPSPVSTLEFHTFTVAAVDAFGNVITNYRGTVHLSSDNNDALFSPNVDYTFTGDDAGVHVFQAAFQHSGTHFIRAVDTVFSNLFGEEDGIEVL